MVETITSNRFQRYESCARGRWQRDVLYQMCQPGGTVNPVTCVAGKARSYRLRYKDSFNGLLARLRGAGAEITIIPGPHLGMYSAVYEVR